VRLCGFCQNAYVKNCTTCLSLSTFLPCRYVWQKDGTILESSSSLQIRHVDGGSTVYIESPTSRHEGFYQCFASNVFGTALTVKALLRKAGIRALQSLLSVEVTSATDNVMSFDH